MNVCTSVNRSKVKLYCLILITHVWQFDVLHTKYCIDTYVGTHTHLARLVVNQWGGVFSLSSGPIHVPGPFGGQPVGGGVLFPLKRTYTCTRPVRWSTSGGPLKRTYTCTRPVRWSTSGGGVLFPLKRTYTCTHTCTQHGHTHVCMQTPTHPHMHTHTLRK